MNMEIFNRAAEALPPELFETPIDCGIILGSGWGNALIADEPIAVISYADIPGLGAAAVPGHSGELKIYRRHGLTIAAFAGRRHWYEGVGMEAVVMPVELLRRMRCRKLLVTNAAGGVNYNFSPGDFMIIDDHINTVGINPLIGPQRDEWGPRFPCLNEVYSSDLRSKLQTAGNDAGVKIFHGIYAFTCGPVFETPAEIRAYARMGADAVGMSTVPECTFALACSMSVAAMSCITNMAAGIGGKALNHEEVIEQSKKSTPLMAKIIDGFFARLAIDTE
jgi:purine-nucleoside phosphorylase